VLFIPIQYVAMSRICTEVGLSPGCSRIKHLSLHVQLLVKEAMLLALIVEQKFYSFCKHSPPTPPWELGTP